MAEHYSRWLLSVYQKVLALLGISLVEFALCRNKQ
jgi:hypothetical protein